MSYILIYQNYLRFILKWYRKKIFTVWTNEQKNEKDNYNKYIKEWKKKYLT